MKIYFTASVFQKDLYGDNYEKIVNILTKLGHAVIHNHVTSRSMVDINKLTESDNIEHYKKVKKWISDSDLVVAEVSFPSTLNVGHEITLAIEKGKPVICLYSKGKVSTFFQAIKSDKLIYHEYLPDQIEKILKDDIFQVLENTDTRFNFYISPEIGRYLDWVSQHKKLPRAVFLRSLLEKAMKLEKGFEA